MKESKLKSSKSKAEAVSAHTQTPWVPDQKIQYQIEQEAYLRAKENGFRNSAHFYLLSVARDFGYVLPSLIEI